MLLHATTYRLLVLQAVLSSVACLAQPASPSQFASSPDPVQAATGLMDNSPCQAVQGGNQQLAPFGQTLRIRTQLPARASGLPRPNDDHREPGVVQNCCDCSGRLEAGPRELCGNDSQWRIVSTRCPRGQCDSPRLASLGRSSVGPVSPRRGRIPVSQARQTKRDTCSGL